MTVTALERLRAIVASGAPIAPVHSSFGSVLEEVEPGRVVACVPALPPRVLRGTGPVAVLADLVLSGAISSMLSAGQGISTLTLHASGLGPLPPAGTPLRAVGRLSHLDGDSAVSTAEVRDAGGRPVAVLSSRCAVLPVPVAGVVADAYARVPDPFAALRTAVTSGEQEASVRAVAAPSLANSGGALQGGVLAAVAAHALDEVIAAARPHLADAPADLEVTFLRGVPADGTGFAGRAEPVHVGSRLASARAEIRDGRGRLAVVATAAHWRGSRE